MTTTEPENGDLEPETEGELDDEGAGPDPNASPDANLEETDDDEAS